MSANELMKLYGDCAEYFDQGVSICRSKTLTTETHFSTKFRRRHELTFECKQFTCRNLQVYPFRDCTLSVQMNNYATRLKMNGDESPIILDAGLRAIILLSNYAVEFVPRLLLNEQVENRFGTVTKTKEHEFDCYSLLEHDEGTSHVITSECDELIQSIFYRPRASQAVLDVKRSLIGPYDPILDDLEIEITYQFASVIF